MWKQRDVACISSRLFPRLDKTLNRKFFSLFSDFIEHCVALRCVEKKIIIIMMKLREKKEKTLVNMVKHNSNHSAGIWPFGEIGIDSGKFFAVHQSCMKEEYRYFFFTNPQHDNNDDDEKKKKKKKKENLLENLGNNETLIYMLNTGYEALENVAEGFMNFVNYFEKIRRQQKNHRLPDEIFRVLRKSAPKEICLEKVGAGFHETKLCVKMSPGSEIRVCLKVFADMCDESKQLIQKMRFDPKEFACLTLAVLPFINECRITTIHRNVRMVEENGFDYDDIIEAIKYGIVSSSGRFVEKCP